MRMRKPTPIKPMGVSIHDSMLKRVVRRVFYVALVTAYAVLLAMFLMEWAAGCGETYTDAKGVQHVGKCLFINR